MGSENWLRLDEVENAIDNLETCGFLLASLPDPIRWKWGIVALHQAIYGFAISAIQGSDLSSVVTNPAKPESKLISIWDALKRAQDPRNIWPGFSPLAMSKAEAEAVNRISSEFRNGFEHFRPMAWSIEVSGMPQLFTEVLNVVVRLALESGGVRYDDGGRRERTESAAATVRRSLS